MLDGVPSPSTIERLVRLVTESQELNVDVLRVDDSGRGYACGIARQLLLPESGITARLVLLLVNGMFPPPLRFEPIWVPREDLGEAADAEAPKSVMYSCSLSAAVDVLGRLGYPLLRFSGADALFAHQAVAPTVGQAEAADEADCYRHSRIYGFSEIPIEFVQEWAASDPFMAQARAWRNITTFYGRPFSLSLP
jgi:hypothetical protein